MDGSHTTRKSKPKPPPTISEFDKDIGKYIKLCMCMDLGSMHGFAVYAHVYVYGYLIAGMFVQVNVHTFTYIS